MLADFKSPSFWFCPWADLTIEQEIPPATKRWIDKFHLVPFKLYVKNDISVEIHDHL